MYVRYIFIISSRIGPKLPTKRSRLLLEQTLDREQPREFYWALMDYGTHLKATVGNLNKASKHYAKQSAFKGSRRQLRGLIIRMLGDGGHCQLCIRQLPTSDLKAYSMTWLSKVWFASPMAYTPYN